MGFIFIWSGLICCFTDIFWFFLVCNICYWVYFFLYIFCQFRKSFYFCTHETGRVVPAGYWRGPFGFHIWFCFEFLVGAFLIGFLMRDYKRGFSTGFGADFFLMLDTVENFFLKSLFCKKNCYYLCSRNASVTGCLEKKTRVIFEIFS